MTKINNLGSLLAEKERLRRLCKSSEQKLEERIDFFRNNYIELTVDNVFVPALKRTFNLENILHVLNLDFITELLSGTKNNDTNKMSNQLNGFLGKTGWAVALKIGAALIKKLFK